MKQPLGFLRFAPQPDERRNEQDEMRAAWQLLPPQVQEALRARAREAQAWANDYTQTFVEV